MRSTTIASWTFSSLFDFEHHKDVAQVPFIDGASQQRYRFWFWREEEKTGHLNLVLTHTREFEQPGKELKWSVQYTRGWEDEAYFLNDRSALRNASDETHLDALEHTLPFQLDYVKPLRNGRVETGFKLQRREIPSTTTSTAASTPSSIPASAIGPSGARTSMPAT